MKFFVLLLVFLFAVWLFRNRSRVKRHAKPTNVTPQPPEVQTMQACAYCGVHMAHRDMVQGVRSRYCSLDHVQRAGDRPQHG